MTIKEFTDKWGLTVYREEKGDVSVVSLTGHGVMVTVRQGYAEGVVMGWLDCFTLFKTASVQGDNLGQVIAGLSDIMDSWGLGE